MSRLLKTESLGEGGLVNGRTVSCPSYHTLPLEILLRTSDCFRVYRRRRIGRYSPFTTQRLYCGEKPRLVFRLSEHDTDRD